MENYLSDETLYFQVYLQAKEEGVDLQTVHKPNIMNISQQTDSYNKQAIFAILQEDIKFSRIHNTSCGQQKGTSGTYLLMAKGQSNKQKTC